MRVSGARGTHRRSNGHEKLEPYDAAAAVDETTPAEALDDQIESLLISLDESVEPAVVVEAPERDRARRAARKRRGGRRHYRRQRINGFDLFFVATAVVLGLAVGLLTVYLVNG
jgi:hypothetical protein